MTTPDDLTPALDRWGDHLASAAARPMPSELAAAVSRAGRARNHRRWAAPAWAAAAIIALATVAVTFPNQAPRPASALQPLSLAALTRQASDAQGDINAVEFPDAPDSARVRPEEVISRFPPLASR